MFQLQRVVGIMVPLFALRQDDDGGIGDLSALKRLIDWCKEHGVSFILLLPVNSCGRDYSPYNANSSVALEPLYLDLYNKRFFHYLGLKATRHQKKTPSTDCVDYEKVREYKHSVLHEYFNKFVDSKEFLKYIEENHCWLDSYALFSALSEKFHTCDVSLWPKTFRSYSHARLIREEDIDQRANYHKFCQWLCDLAWIEIKEYAEKKNVMLLGDLPFSVSRFSADVWHHPERFSDKWNAGAPPEPNYQENEFVRKWGQNWGIPLYQWDSEKQKGHPWWRERLKALGRYFHGCRLDHALGYFRVYGFPWHPSQNYLFENKTQEQILSEGGDLPRFFPCSDDTPESREINLNNGRNFFNFIKKIQPKLLYIAEDLGVVPDYVRPFLEEISVPGIKIPYFERLLPDLRYLPSHEYPVCSLVTWATHDQPPLAALWNKWQQNRKNSSAEDWEIKCLLNFLELPEENYDPELSDEIHERAIHKISSSRSSLLCLQLTDWFKLKTRFNIPGTQNKNNWSARLPFTVESLFTDDALIKKSENLVRIFKETDRVHRL